MQLQTFKAATMADALGQVKDCYGNDAVILHTRTYHVRSFLGLRRREVVEITAGHGLNVGQRAARKAAAAPSATSLAAYRGTGGFDRVVALAAAPAPQIAPTVRRAPAIADPITNSRQLLETPAAGAAVMLGISSEMSSLKTMVKELAIQVRHNKAPQVPEDLFEYYFQLVQNQVAEELAADIVKTLKQQVRPEHLSQPQFMREKIAEQIERLIPPGGAITRRKTVGPHTVALIGPTGVGKTTTLAKLAANLQLTQGHRVGLITMDTYRIAAVEQLRKYAEILGAPLKVVGSAEEMGEAMRVFANMEFVLIDTAGRSPKDVMKLNELKGLLAAARPDEVHLVLSSTIDQQSLELAASRFGEVRTDKIIFTKLDEAAHVGTVLNVVRKVNKSLSYITTGQNVPADIEEGRGRRLAQLILGSMGT